jgi:hypothetical protein
VKASRRRRRRRRSFVYSLKHAKLHKVEFRILRYYYNYFVHKKERNGIVEKSQSNED